MPTFTPGWNAGTLLWIIGGALGIAGVVTAAFVTARYSLLSKVLEVQESMGKRAEDRADKTFARFDAMESKLHSLEAELNASRGETLAARQEVLALKQSNVDLLAAKLHVEAELAAIRTENRTIRNENKRLSGECEMMRRQMGLDSVKDTIA